MLKYYLLMFAVVGIALFYVFLQDPCHRRVREDFANKYPGYELLGSGASEGSPETVRCRISYRKPGSEETYEDTWLYQDSGSGWKFSRIVETGRAGDTGEDDGEGLRDGAREASAGAGEQELGHWSYCGSPRVSCDDEWLVDPAGIHHSASRRGTC